MSDLASVRRSAVIASRRHDLLKDADLDSNVDAGMDVYVNEALRFLDQRVEHPKMFRRHVAVLSTGGFQVEVPRLISVKRLWVKNSEGVSDVTEYYVEPELFRSNYPDLLDEWDTGEPCYWTQNDVTLSPGLAGSTQASLEAAGALDVDDLDFGVKPESQFLIFNPKADGSYTIDVLGRFFSAPLVENGDKNFWTVQHPDLLELATCYMLELRMQNSARQDSWMKAIDRKVHEIECAFVEREMAGGKGLMNG